MDELKFITRHDIEPVVVGEYTLRKHLDKYYEVADNAISDACFARAGSRTAMSAE